MLVANGGGGGGSYSVNGGGGGYSATPSGSYQGGGTPVSYPSPDPADYAPGGTWESGQVSPSYAIPNGSAYQGSGASVGGLTPTPTGGSSPVSYPSSDPADYSPGGAWESGKVSPVYVPSVPPPQTSPSLVLPYDYGVGQSGFSPSYADPTQYQVPSEAPYPPMPTCLKDPITGQLIAGDRLWKFDTGLDASYLYAPSGLTSQEIKDLYGLSGGFATKVMPKEAFLEGQTDWKEVTTVEGTQVQVPWNPEREAEGEYIFRYGPPSDFTDPAYREAVSDIAAQIREGTYTSWKDLPMIQSHMSQYGLDPVSSLMEIKRVTGSVQGAIEGGSGGMPYGYTDSQAQTAVDWLRASGQVAAADAVAQDHLGRARTTQDFIERSELYGIGTLGKMGDFREGLNYDLPGCLAANVCTQDELVRAGFPEGAVATAGAAALVLPYSTVEAAIGAGIPLATLALATGISLSELEVIKERVGTSEAPSTPDVAHMGFGGGGLGLLSSMAGATGAAMPSWVSSDPFSAESQAYLKGLYEQDEGLSWFDKSILGKGSGVMYVAPGTRTPTIHGMQEHRFAGMYQPPPLTGVGPMIMPVPVGAIGTGITRVGHWATKTLTGWKPWAIPVGSALVGIGRGLAQPEPTIPYTEYQKGTYESWLASPDVKKQIEGIRAEGGEPQIPTVEEFFEGQPIPLEYREGFAGVFGRGMAWQAGGLEALRGDRSWYHPLGLASGMGRYMLTPISVAEMWPTKGPAALVAGVPHFGPTWGMTGLRWGELSHGQRALGIGTGLIPYATGPLGMALGKVGGAIGKIPVVGPVARVVSWPFKQAYGMAGTAMKPIAPYMPWQTAYQLSGLAGKAGLARVPGLAGFGVKAGWWDPKIVPTHLRPPEKPVTTLTELRSSVKAQGGKVGRQGEDFVEDFFGKRTNATHYWGRTADGKWGLYESAAKGSLIESYPVYLKPPTIATKSIWERYPEAKARYDALEAARKAEVGVSGEYSSLYRAAVRSVKAHPTMSPDQKAMILERLRLTDFTYRQTPTRVDVSGAEKTSTMARTEAYLREITGIYSTPVTITPIPRGLLRGLGEVGAPPVGAPLLGRITPAGIYSSVGPSALGRIPVGSPSGFVQGITRVGEVIARAAPAALALAPFPMMASPAIISAAVTAPAQSALQAAGQILQKGQITQSQYDSLMESLQPVLAGAEDLQTSILSRVSEEGLTSQQQQQLQQQAQEQVQYQVQQQVQRQGLTQVQQTQLQQEQTQIQRLHEVEAQQELRTQVQYPIQTQIQAPIFTQVTTPVHTQITQPIHPSFQQPVKMVPPPPPPLFPPMFGGAGLGGGGSSGKSGISRLGVGKWGFKGFRVSGPHPFGKKMVWYDWFKEREVPWGIGQSTPIVRQKASSGIKGSGGLVRIAA